MKTWLFPALAACLLMGSCAPYPYYGENYYGNGYQSNGTEWILPATAVAAAAVLTGVAINDYNRHEKYERAAWWGYPHHHGGGYGYHRY